MKKRTNQFKSWGVPEELRRQPQWFGWTPSPSGNYYIHDPRNGKRVAFWDVDHIADFNTACGTYRKSGCAGVAFYLLPFTDLSVLTLYNCVGPGQRVSQAAREVVKWFDTYVEFHPTGRSLTLLFYACGPYPAGACMGVLTARQFESSCPLRRLRSPDDFFCTWGWGVYPASGVAYGTPRPIREVGCQR